MTTFSDNTRHEIAVTLAKLQLYEVESAVRWKIRWKRSGNWCSNLAKVATSMSIVCDFVAGFYDIKAFIFAAGCTNVLAVVLVSFSQYCFNQGSERARELDTIVEACAPLPSPPDQQVQDVSMQVGSEGKIPHDATTALTPNVLT